MFAPDNNALWMAYFERRHEEQITATNGVEPRSINAMRVATGLPTASQCAQEDRHRCPLRLRGPG